jgi:hypothetical protein
VLVAVYGRVRQGKGMALCKLFTAVIITAVWYQLLCACRIGYAGAKL